MDKRIEELAGWIQSASDLYYNGYDSGVTDYQWDTWVAELRQLDPNHPILKRTGARVDGHSGWDPVTHPFVVKGLGKAQTYDEVRKWAKKIPRPTVWVVMEKLDGISILLTYEKGNLVCAATRGNGVTGEDITRNVLKMKGVPQKIDTLETTYVRGEIILTHGEMQAHFPDAKNPRNTAAGTAKRHDGTGCEHLTVVCYELLKAQSAYPTKVETLQELSRYGFNVVRYYHYSELAFCQVKYLDYENQGERKRLDYDIDGLVLQPNDMKKFHGAGESNVPKGAIAWKFAHDSDNTTLIDIEWQVGHTGRVTPVAIFDPIDLAGAEVQRASLHNVPNIEKLWSMEPPRVGDDIVVSRRNDVIPYVEQVVNSRGGIDLYVPHNCPDCGTMLERDGAYLVCPNSTGCPPQLSGSIKNWIKKTDMKHWGDAVVEALIGRGIIRDYADLYLLTEGHLSKLTMEGRIVGPSTAKKLIESRETCRNLPLAVMLGSMGTPLWSRSSFQNLVDQGFDTFDKIKDLVEVTQNCSADCGRWSPKENRWVEYVRLHDLDKVGAKKVKVLLKEWPRISAMMQKLNAVGVTIQSPAKPAELTKDSSGAMVGEAVVFTGFRDAALQKEVEQNGGDMRSSVSKKVTLVVTKDPNSSSSKVKKAKSLGIPVISRDELEKRLQT